MTSPPRGIATFGFDVTSPATLGDYRMSWTLMSHDQAVVSTGVAVVVQVVAARCAELRSLIASLPGEIEGLEAQLNSAAPGEKGAIARQLKALRTKLAKARDEAQSRGCPP